VGDAGVPSPSTLLGAPEVKRRAQAGVVRETGCGAARDDRHPRDEACDGHADVGHGPRPTGQDPQEVRGHRYGKAEASPYREEPTPGVKTRG
jgi:hypothetical protein